MQIICSELDALSALFCNRTATELEHGAIAGCFHYNPLPRPLISSPLQTVPKRGSTKRRVVMGLSFPPSYSVSSGIPDNSHLNEHYKLRLPGIDRLCQSILQHGRGCLLYKLDLRRAYRPEKRLVWPAEL